MGISDFSLFRLYYYFYQNILLLKRRHKMSLIDLFSTRKNNCQHRHKSCRPSPVGGILFPISLLIVSRRRFCMHMPHHLTIFFNYHTVKLPHQKITFLNELLGMSETRWDKGGS